MDLVHALVRIRLPVLVLYSGVNDTIKVEELSNLIHRHKREYLLDQRVYLNSSGQPARIQDEFKAQQEVRAELDSILPWITINKNVSSINYIYYNQQRFINQTCEVVKAVGEQLHETSRMAGQNRQALDWILAEKGGVCHMFGKHCCKLIPNSTAPDGTFLAAMNRLLSLRLELKENAGRNNLSWDWLDQILRKWGALITSSSQFGKSFIQVIVYSVQLHQFSFSYLFILRFRIHLLITVMKQDFCYLIVKCAEKRAGGALFIKQTMCP